MTIFSSILTGTKTTTEPEHSAGHQSGTSAQTSSMDSLKSEEDGGGRVKPVVKIFKKQAIRKKRSSIYKSVLASGQLLHKVKHGQSLGGNPHPFRSLFLFSPRI
jgi:hypothetical protein